MLIQGYGCDLKYSNECLRFLYNELLKEHSEPLNCLSRLTEPDQKSVEDNGNLSAVRFHSGHKLSSLLFRIVGVLVICKESMKILPVSGTIPLETEDLRDTFSTEFPLCV